MRKMESMLVKAKAEAEAKVMFVQVSDLNAIFLGSPDAIVKIDFSLSHILAFSHSYSFTPSQKE